MQVVISPRPLEDRSVIYSVAGKSVCIVLPMPVKEQSRCLLALWMVTSAWPFLLSRVVRKRVLRDSCVNRNLEPFRDQRSQQDLPYLRSTKVCSPPSNLLYVPWIHLAPVV